MKSNLTLSGIALAVLALAIAPASAQTINLLGGSDSGGVSVDLGGSGSGGTGVDASVGSGSLLGGTGGNALNLGGTGDNTQVAVGTGDDQDDVLLTLFGSPGAGDADGSDFARANILPDGLGGGGADDATVTLFGSGSDGATTTADLFGGGGTGGVGNTDVSLDLFGPDAGGGGAGGGGTDPTETGSIGNNSAGSNAGALPATRVASTVGTNVRAGGNCFAPDETQIAHLIARGSYDASVTASWQAASNVSVVPVNLCPDARSRLAAAIDADANIGRMQAAVATNSAISSEIAPEYQADDVLAVDRSGNSLTVYVY